MFARTSSASLCVALALCLMGCPGPDEGEDTGVDAPGSMEDAGVDAPRADVGPGADAGRETDCSGTGCDFVELELTAESTCARRENGAVICWGYAQDGQLGDGRMRHAPGCVVPSGMAALDCSAVPVAVDLAVPALELEGGAHSMCAVTGTDRTHLCWGERGFSIDDSLATDRFAPVLEPTFDGATLEDAQSHGCWIDGDSTAAVHCIGSNGAGQLGNGSRMVSILPVVPTRESDDTPITGALEIVAGTYGGNTCVRTATEVLCWGTNDRGQLGDGVMDHPDVEDDCGSDATASDCSLRAVVVDIDATMVVELAQGFDHTCAHMSDGTLWCWGGNAYGQLGTGNNDASFVPVQVPGVAGVASLSVNGYTTCVLGIDGRVQCWGQANLGQVGDGAMDHDLITCSVDCQLSPVFVDGLDDAVALGTGFSHSCAITETNAIVCWGDNNRFQLGDSDREPHRSPTPVMGL